MRPIVILPELTSKTIKSKTDRILNYITGVNTQGVCMRIPYTHAYSLLEQFHHDGCVEQW